jgi:hypothetical protein
MVVSAPGMSLAPILIDERITRDRPGKWQFAHIYYDNFSNAYDEKKEDIKKHGNSVG